MLVGPFKELALFTRGVVLVWHKQGGLLVQIDPSRKRVQIHYLGGAKLALGLVDLVRLGPYEGFSSLEIQLPECAISL